MMKISGTFEVKLTPLDISTESVNDLSLGRMSIDKTFHGDLSAKSQGEMLTAITPISGSAGYVAIEQVTGCLSGKQGSFVLQHFGIMTGVENQLILEVVPDSATDELIGLSGKMTINIEDGQHFYEFEYDFS